MEIEELNSELEKLVQEHKQKHQIALESAVKVGMFLLDLKKTVPEGEWVEYADTHCTLSATSRKDYMRLARFYLVTGEYPASSSVSVAIGLISASEEVKLQVKEIEERGGVVTDPQLREMKRAKPTLKRLNSTLKGFRKVVSLGKENPEIAYKDWLELRDGVEEALTEVNEVLIGFKGERR